MEGAPTLKTEIPKMNDVVKDVPHVKKKSSKLNDIKSPIVKGAFYWIFYYVYTKLNDSFFSEKQSFG